MRFSEEKKKKLAIAMVKSLSIGLVDKQIFRLVTCSYTKAVHLL